MREIDLLKKYRSPLYVYDEKILNEKSKNMLQFANKLKEKTGITDIKIHYSTKANGNLYLLKQIKNIGLAVDAMSPVELKLAQMAGFEKEDILYVCNNVSGQEMEEVAKKGILLCLDSISQVETFGQVRPNSKVMVRINPGKSGIGFSEKVITAGKDTKFGISEENIPELLLVAKKYNIKIIGTHQHLGTLFLNDKIEEYIEGVKAGLRIAKQYFEDLEVIDLGGGFGVPYKEDEEELDLNLVAEKLVPILSDFVKEYHMIGFKFEPGRYIPCEAGYILGMVNAIKNEHNKVWVGTDIGMNVLIRPTMYDAYHKIEVIKEDNRRNEKLYYCNNYRKYM